MLLLIMCLLIPLAMGTLATNITSPTLPRDAADQFVSDPVLVGYEVGDPSLF